MEGGFFLARQTFQIARTRKNRDYQNWASQIETVKIGPIKSLDMVVQIEFIARLPIINNDE